MPTTRFDFGDIVLVPFPFTDQSAAKRRPAVVVSNAAYNRARLDLVLMAVISQFRATAAVGEVWIRQWQQARLLKPSAIKPVFATIEQGLIVRRLGALAADDKVALQAIAEVIGYREVPASAISRAVNVPTPVSAASGPARHAAHRRAGSAPAP